MVQFKSFTSGAAPAAAQVNPLVAALLRQSLSNAPIRHPLQGFDKLGKAALAAFLKNEDAAAEKAKAGKRSSAIAEFLRLQQGTAGQVFAPEVAARSPDVPAREGFTTPAMPPTPDDQNAALGALAQSGDPGLEQLALVQALAGKTGGGFSLNPGQSRFGGSGDLIASLPAKSNLLSQEEVDQKIQIAKAGKSPGGATPAQTANNAEIDAARSRLLALRLELQPGQTLRDLVIKKTQRADDTGLGNPGFDLLTLSDLRTASQRKVGDDPGFGEFFDQLDVAAALPPPELAPEPEPEGPGFLSRTFDSLFGGDDAAAAEPAAPGLPAAESFAENLSPAAAQSRGGRFGPRGVGRSGIDTLPTSGTGVQAQPRARGRRRRGPAGAARPISRMGARELNDLLGERGEALSLAKRKEIKARLDALGL